MKKSIVIAGAAGEGINTVEHFIERILKKNGYEIFSYKNYMSRVRGGYNYSTIVISDELVFAPVDKADIFIALNREAYEHSSNQMHEGAMLIAMKDLAVDAVEEGNILFEKSLLSAESKAKNAFSMASVGAVLKIFGCEEGMLNETYNKKWTDEVNLENLKAAKFGFETTHLQVETPKHTG
jgi:2-oxoglutarate ferredoxin oxidoreductase subunit alpha